MIDKMTKPHPVITNIQKHISLEAKELKEIAETFHLEKVLKKHFLAKAGSIYRYFYFVSNGCLKKYYINTEGKERIFEFALDNYWIGDLYSFTNKKTSIYNIIALEDTWVYMLSYDNRKLLLEKFPKLESYFRLIYEKTIRHQDIRIKQGLSCSAEERYIDFRENYPGLELRIPQKEVAKYIAVSPEFLSTLRAKKEL